MSGQQAPPTGTFSTSQGPSKPKSYACGCIHRQVLIMLLALIFLSICVLSAIAVWAGINNHQTYNHGEIKIDLSNYTVTRINGSSLGLSAGWLKYSDGTNTGLKDLSNLTVASAVLGFLMAFILLIAIIISGWKVLSSCCIKKGHKSGGTCAYLMIGAVAITMQFAFLLVTAKDIDNYAHNKLGVSASNDVAMVPGYAWNCGTAAAFLWIFAAIFNACIPTQPQEEYHKF